MIASLIHCKPRFIESLPILSYVYGQADQRPNPPVMHGVFGWLKIRNRCMLPYHVEEHFIIKGRPNHGGFMLVESLIIRAPFLEQKAVIWLLTR